ncbi:MAG: hypothetical protein H0V82_07735 [Candidatus Protochlamydia sp.]|nr:hypothetical protein [Candidatus Protochlamydia sp.]
MIQSSHFSSPYIQPAIIQAEKETEPQQTFHEYDKNEGTTTFEKKHLRVLQEKSSKNLHEWISNFDHKLSFCEHQGIHKAGVIGFNLIYCLLDFPENSPLASTLRSYLLELIQSKNFLDKCINLDEFAENIAEKHLERIKDGIKSLVTPSKFVDISQVPENLEVNPHFVSDPRIMLYNIFAESGNGELSQVDDTFEMELALILAGLREDFFQKTIPQDEKERAAVEIYLKNKLQDKLSLIQIGSIRSDVDEKIINLVYKRKTPKSQMDEILNGNDATFNKFDYINTQNKKTRYTIPIKKKQGYANSKGMIDYVFNALNDSEKSVSLLKERLQHQSGLKGYFDENGEKITKEGVMAVLFSAGYLQEATSKKEYYY